MGKFIDLTDKKFGRLTVINYLGQSKWLCRCECGNETISNGYELRKGKAKSCGCLRTERIILEGKKRKIHGMRNTRLYRTWCKIKERCYDPNCKSFKNYGARGITMDKEWFNSFLSFYNWAICNQYADSLSIDRIDVNGNYEPSNCRWITMKEQQSNKRNNRSFIWENKKFKTIAELEKYTAIPYARLYDRLVKKKWSIEKSLTTPLLKNQYTQR